MQYLKASQPRVIDNCIVEGGQRLWRLICQTIIPSASHSYNPKEYWKQRGQTFINEEYQRGLYWQHDWMLDKLMEIQPATLLEVGCGFGRNLRFMTRNLPDETRYVGVDLSQSMLQHAQCFLSGLPIPLINANALSLPFGHASFDVILLHGVFMHIPPSQVDTAISEVKRVARNHILVCEQNYSGQTPDGHGNVQINDFTFAYDYSRRFHAAGLFVFDHRSVEDLDAFLLKKRDAKYDLPERIDLDRLNPNHAHAIILRQIPPGVRVLDVGCATGYLGRYLTEEQGCTVDGVEYDLQAAEIARQYYRRVWVGDVEDEVLLADIPGPYDVVMCPAVLEHLARPDLVLRRLRRLIAPGGFLIASLPNVAHWSVRWKLLRGRWDYTEYGLLDRTHLRFYTLRTAQELLENVGYRVTSVQWSNVGVGPVESVLRGLPRGRYRIRRWLLEKMPELFGHELIFVARKADD